MDPVSTTLIMTMLLPAIIGKCTDVVTNVGMEGWKKLSALGNALTEFAKAYPDQHKAVDKAFTTWAKSGDFVAECRKLKPPLSIEPLVDSFCRVTGLTESPVTNVPLQELVGEFLIEFSIQLEIVDERARIKSERANFLKLERHIGTVVERVNDVSADVKAIGDNITTVEEKVEAVGTDIRCTTSEVKSVQENQKHLEILIKNVADDIKAMKELQGQLQAQIESSKIQPLSAVASALSYEVQESEDREEAEFELHSKIDACVEHYKHGQIETAISLLKALRNSLVEPTKTSHYLRSRIASGLGGCYVRLNDTENAEKEYQRALNLRQSRLAYSNMALAKLLKDSFEEALENSRKAMEYTKQSGRSIAIHLQALYFSKELEELAATIKSHKLLCNSDPDCILAQGQIEYHGENFLRAKGYYDKVTEKNPYDCDIILLSADCALKAIEIDFAKRPPLNGKLTDDQLNHLHEVEALIERALKLAGNYDYTQTRIRALELRVALHFLLGNFDLAQKDSQTMLQLDPKHQTALLKAGSLAMLIEKDYETAVAYFEQVEPKFLDPVAPMVAGAYCELGQYDKAEELLKAFETAVTTKNLWYVFAYQRLKLAAAKGCQGNVATQLLNDFADNGDVLYALSEFYNNSKDTDKALKLIDEATKTSSCSLILHVPRLKAQIYFDGKLWGAAIKTYETIPNFRDDEQDHSQYIVALANDGMLGSAGAEAKEARLRRGGGVIDGISAIEAAANLERFNDPRMALKLLIEHDQKFPCERVTELIAQANQKIRRKHNDLSDPYGG